MHPTLAHNGGLGDGIASIMSGRHFALLFLDLKLVLVVVKAVFCRSG